jgi:hypothetical protein
LKTHVEILFFICSHFLPLELLSSCCLDHTLWLVLHPLATHHPIDLPCPHFKIN